MGRWMGCLLMLTFACSRGNPWFGAASDGDDSSGEDRATTDAVVTTSATSGGATSSGESSSSSAESTTSAVDPDTTVSPVTSEDVSTTTSDDTTSDVSTSSETSTTGETSGDTTDTGDDTTGEPPGCVSVCGTPGCGACPNAPQVDIDGYKIDKYEVKNEHYDAFLAAAVSPTLQPQECQWNLDFTRKAAPPANSQKVPVVNVDWCDAHAYCAWAGRRLCGKIGGGPVAPGEATDPAKDQWYLACASPAKKILPYGNTYMPMRCNDAPAGNNKPVEVGAMENCVGSPAALHDMSGNVWEWVDSCQGTEPDAECLRRGGSFLSDVAKDLQCNLISDRPRSERLNHVGIRCCSL